MIVHELLHFHVPNYGKLWESLMRAHVGDWERCEAIMRKMGESNLGVGLRRSRSEAA